MVERIRTLLARFPEDDEAVRRLVAREVSFDALCSEYGKVIKLLDAFEAPVKLARDVIRCASIHTTPEVPFARVPPRRFVGHASWRHIRGALG